MGFMKKVRHNEEGSIVIETAAMMSVLALIAVGVLDFGLAYARNLQLANAARAGMQYALVRKPVGEDYSAIEAAVTASAPDADADSARQVETVLYCECPDGTASDCTTEDGIDITCDDGTLRKAYLDITISETYNLLISYPGLEDGLSLSESVTVRLN
ncbi:MAG: pilus assembly protein [Alphaproteobacteria bacterium]|nr:pilus assembly protein [Alphaproteobacteria bacterium]